MMSTMITYEVALRRLQGAVEAKGADHRPAEGCRYFDADGQPLCIVGVAFEPELRAAGIDTGNANGASANHLAQRGVLDVTEKANLLLNVAQDRQDRGLTWGEAVESAVAGIGPRSDLDDTRPVSA